MAHGLTAIAWDAPWLAHLREPGEAVARSVAQGAHVWEALNLQVGASLRFVAQAELPPGSGYEEHIFRTGHCPTRDGAHDFFNGLCWLRFPRSKRRLNELHAAQIALHGVQGGRGKARDAMTLLDENGALLQGPDALWQALAAQDWARLFGELRPLWAQAQLVLLGHALLEKLLAPRKGMTAHVYRCQGEVTSLQELDRWLEQDLSADKLAHKPFAPLPVLGVPGWCKANEEPDFYRDAAVFRVPGPRTRAQSAKQIPAPGQAKVLPD